MGTNGVLAVIGGSGLYSFPGLDEIEEHNIKTPFGDPSDAILSGKIGGRSVLFLARHGKRHSILPSEINYRANIYALKSLGASWCVGVGAVGSLAEELAPGNIVIPDQAIDFTRNRAPSFFGEGIVAHVSMAEPFCPVLRDSLVKSACKVFPEERVHDGGTYLCIEGPLFSTKAESNLYRTMNAAIIGMTNMPEAKLAREAEIAYAGLNLVTDYDCWREGEDSVEVSTVLQVLKENAENATKIIHHVIKDLTDKEPSTLASKALSHALVTDLKFVPKERLSDLSAIIGRFL